MCEACSKLTPSGIATTPRSTIQSITLMYSEKPPPEASPTPAVVPTRLYVGHCENTLRWQ